jgi:hypothetical protein
LPMGSLADATATNLATTFGSLLLGILAFEYV